MRYHLRQELFAIGDDYWIEGDRGEPVFRVDGKAMSIRKRLVLETPAGREVLTIQKKLLSIRETMTIEREGKTVAMVAKGLIAPLRDRFSMKLANGDVMEVSGNIVDHEYRIERDGHEVAQVSKSWFSMRDAYGIEIAEGEEDALVLAVAVCVDQLSHDID